MSLEATIRRHFPGSLVEDRLVRRSGAALAQHHGFVPVNSLACVGVCRDELCRSLVHSVESHWGESFDMSSLGGMLTLGRTGFAAARQHAPEVNGRRRFVFFLFAHIGIEETGEPGLARRPGQQGASPACGALGALLANASDRAGGGLDRGDLEQSFLKARIRMVLGDEEPGDLISVTQAAHQAAVEDLSLLAAETLDPATEDYAVVSGIQIHRPTEPNLAWLGASYVVVQGTRSEIWV